VAECRAQLAGVDESVTQSVAGRFSKAMPGLREDSWGVVTVTLLDKLGNGVQKIERKLGLTGRERGTRRPETASTIADTDDFEIPAFLRKQAD